MKSTLLFALAFAGHFVFSAQSLSAQAWVNLGSCKVHGSRDYDEIYITGSRGDFKAIKLFVENEGIDFDRVAVHFGNGQVDRVELKNFIPAGGETRVIDLAGGDRVIKKVVFYYRSNPATGKKGKVVLFGRR